MALRTIRLSIDGILRKKSKEVKQVNDRIRELLDDMVETMVAADGVGLAAPQIGILRRIIVIDVGEGAIELINPEIVESSGIQRKSEGCLSIPGKNGYVERPAFVKVKALNREGEEILIEGEDLKAVALCHEIDHLDGILYIDKLIDVPEGEELEGEEFDDNESGNGESDENVSLKEV